jgi:hypothetical protein
MKTTIKEVYEQCLANGWLGTHKADFTYRTGIAGRLIGYLEGYEFPYKAVVKNGFKEYNGFGVNAEVEWIGNQPKKKMLYACECWWDQGTSIFKVWSDKKIKPASFIKWLPEEQYPPIEIEGD